MTVRAKFQLTAITDHDWGGKTLKFDARYDESIPEDQKFQKYTPTGSIEMAVDNPAAVAQFEIGEAYYVDFSRAPKAV